MSYSVEQIANARTIFDFWHSKKASDILAASWVADADREDGLKPWLVGDRGTAFGIAQHHMARLKLILAATGVDMRTASVADQCRGIYYEVTKGACKHVLPILMDTRTLWGVNAILIAQFEMSADHASDLAKQVPKAEHWLATFGGRA